MTRGGYTDTSTVKHVRTAHRKAESLARRPAPPVGVVLKCKLTGDSATAEPPVVDARLFTIPVDFDMDGMRLEFAVVAVGTVSSSGAVTIQIVNETQAHTLLNTDGPAASVFIKDCSASIVAYPNDLVAVNDTLVIKCIAAGTGARGLGCALHFRRFPPPTP
jgi:hypothetical protein